MAKTKCSKSSTDRSTSSGPTSPSRMVIICSIIYSSNHHHSACFFKKENLACESRGASASVTPTTLCNWWMTAGRPEDKKRLFSSHALVTRFIFRCADPNILSEFNYNPIRGTAEATLFSMFKFPESKRAHFQCDIVICRGLLNTLQIIISSACACYTNSPIRPMPGQ